jgi:hypothetical protein
MRRHGSDDTSSRQAPPFHDQPRECTAFHWEERSLEARFSRAPSLVAMTHIGGQAVLTTAKKAGDRQFRLRKLLVWPGHKAACTVELRATRTLR